MDIGLGLWTMRSTAPLPGSYPALYVDALESARLAEQLGFHSLWLAEHHFWYDGWCPAPLTAAAAVLAVTTRLRVGTGIHLLALSDLDRTAEEIDTLQRLSGCRLEYGVGLGYRASEYDGYGLSRRSRGRRMDAALDGLLERWRSGASEGPSTIWVGGFAEAALRRIARHGLSALLPSTLRSDQTVRAISQLRQEADRAGRKMGRVAIMKYAWVAESERDLERARATHTAVTKEYTGAWFPLKERPGFESPELVDAQVARALDTAIIGTPDQVVQELGEIAEAGAELVVLHLLGDGRGHGTHQAMRLIADQVIPKLSGVMCG